MYALVPKLRLGNPSPESSSFLCFGKLELGAWDRANMPCVLIPTRYVGMQSRRAAPRVSTNVLRIRDAARPASHSHAARSSLYISI